MVLGGLEIAFCGIWPVKVVSGGTGQVQNRILWCLTDCCKNSGCLTGCRLFMKRIVSLVGSYYGPGPHAYKPYLPRKEHKYVQYEQGWQWQTMLNQSSNQDDQSHQQRRKVEKWNCENSIVGRADNKFQSTVFLALLSRFKMTLIRAQFGFIRDADSCCKEPCQWRSLFFGPTSV